MKKLVFMIILTTLVLYTVPLSTNSWSNGGYSADLNNPDYGTHDWIVEEAVKMLPSGLRTWITDNYVAFFLGTEAPDNSTFAAPYTSIGDYGDKTNHHIYFDASGNVVDDSSAIRAQEEYDKTVSALNEGNETKAAFFAGACTHYLADMSVWAHVTGSGSHWGPEDTLKHGEYETEVEKTIPADFMNDPANEHTSTVFASYISFDGTWTERSAHDVAVFIANFTETGSGTIYDPGWMEANIPMGPAGTGTGVGYNDWDPEFKDQCGASINVAVNAIAEVLLKLSGGSFEVSEFPTFIQGAFIGIIGAILVIMMKQKSTRIRSDKVENL